MKDKKEKLEGLLERLTELRKETDLYTNNLINEIKDIVRETNRETKVTRLVPFDVTKAKQGAKIVTRDGYNVRILCFDRNSDSYPIVALVQNTDSGEDEIISYTKHGYFFEKADETGDDLFIEEECV